ncbi:MAG: hypothetical protein ACJ72N_07345 [Labedaea sp.]
MILDYHADYHRAMLYGVLDLDTGRWLDEGLPLFFADDEAGLYRVYREDESGNYYLDPDNPDEIAREERRGRIKIVLKPQYESEEQGLALGRAEQERFRRKRDEALRVAMIRNRLAHTYRPE